MIEITTEQELQELKERLIKLEDAVFTKKHVQTVEGTFKGLNGGIDLLIKNGFLDKPKKFGAIFQELKRENYHYGKGAVAKALSVHFVNKMKILTRYGK